MLAKDLIKFLSDFNPNANIKLIANGQSEDLVFGGWLSNNGDDTSEKKRNIEFEKAKAEEVYLHLLREEYPNGCEISSNG